MSCKIIESGQFMVAAFGIDGESVGMEVCIAEKLSPKWLGVCSSMLNSHGSVFSADWGGNLSHIVTKFTSANGVALITFEARGALAASAILLSGTSNVAEADALRLFVDSLRKIDLVKATGASAPFRDMFGVEARPAMLVIPWADPGISEMDHKLVQELATHLAGAYFGFDARR